MFETLLIANRGEIACRIIATARRLGIRTVAVFSDADAGSMHVEAADEALRIGPAPATQSYLNGAALVAAIRDSGADAVHPGYGFLSENGAFAHDVAAAGATFVGPSPDAIDAMGSKIEAKRLVAKAGTPVVPGYNGDDQRPETLADRAGEIGYPVLIKAAMGGGGKGMRRVDVAVDFTAALAGAKREAMAAFGDDAVLVERCLTAPKHIEIQVLADAHGKTLSLYERDCSVQRRHQKVIEEAPAPTIGRETRARMGAAAVQAAGAVGYVGAGTVEFIVEGDEFYFMEMNTRLQVEHPVTEAILGLDLVEWQLRIAAGEPLALDQTDLAIDGHAIEARLYAENVRGKRALPSTGTLRHVAFGDARVDGAIRAGTEVTVHYDPMLAKVIAHGPTREVARRRLDDALRATQVAGVEHNISWVRNALAHPDFVAGNYTTLTAERDAEHLRPKEDAWAIAAGVLGYAIRRRARRQDPWSRFDGFRIAGTDEAAPSNREQTRSYTVATRVRCNRKTLDARVTSASSQHWVTIAERQFHFEDVRLVNGALAATVDGRRATVQLVEEGQDIFAMRDGATERVTVLAPDAGAFGRASERGGRIVAPMPGRIVSVAVKPGDSVRAEQVLVALEAMKMEHGIRAQEAGIVREVRCAEGDRVDEGVELVTVAAN